MWTERRNQVINHVKLMLIDGVNYAKEQVNDKAKHIRKPRTGAKEPQR